MTANTSQLVVLAALMANLFIAAAKFIAALFTRSAAMAAEAIHSAADTFNQILLLVGIKKYAKQADELHPFGFSLESYFWSFILGIFIFTTGALFSIYQGITRLRRPESLAHVPYAFAALVFSLAAEYISFRFAFKKIKKEKGRYGIFTYLRRAKKSELVVLFMEEMAAMIGLIIALAMLAVAHFTGNFLYDALASILIGLLLAAVALFLGFETKSLLIGESADPELLKKVYNLLRQEEYIQRVVHIRSLQLGPEEILLAIKAAFDPRLNAGQVANLISGMEKDIRARFPDIKRIFVESELFFPSRQIRIN